MTLLYRIGRKSMVSLLVTLFLVAAVFAATANAQTGTGSLRGQVVDPSGAVVANATVLVLPAQGAAITATTNKDGGFDVKTLLPGKYTVQVFATGFAQFEAKDVAITAGSAAVLNVHLSIEVQKEKVEVSETSTQLDTSSEANANSITIKGKDLEALSDDPDEMQDELTALAGPSAGPNGGQMYIDGFTAGQLPPKSSIREIRINQNPFSAEYDQLGYGRIEVFTKPGTDQFHGQFMVHGNSDAFNARNPFLGDAEQPSYHSLLYNGNIGGPVIKKKASFFFNIDRRVMDEISIINTPSLDANFNPIQFTQAVPNPRTRTNLTPRVDYQLNSHNTLSVRYQYYRENEQNDGIGQFSLPTQGYNSLDTEHTVQISDTQTLSERVINETRFQYVRADTNQTVLNTTPSVNVSGAFTGGGNSIGNLLETTGSYEVQNYTSIVAGKHFIKFGVRSRIDRDTMDKTQGFNGSFMFNSLTSYQITEEDLQAGFTPDQIRADCRGTTPTGSPICGGASQFTLTAGNSRVDNNYADVEPYVQDEWRVRPNITFSYGLRYEWQNQIGNSGGIAPRLGLAWGLGKSKSGSPKAVLRAGYGIFYNRLKQQYIEQALLLNGITQQQFIITNPDFFPNLPTAAELAAAQTAPTSYQVDANWKTPYIMQTGVTLEKQLTRNANVAFTYLNSRGVHQMLTRNINAPLPPAYDLNDRPLGGDENVFQYEPAGNFKQNQVIINGSVRVGAKLSLFGYYTLNYSNSDTNGITSFPSNQYNLALDYGRAAFDIRNRLFLGGTISLPYMFRLSPFLVASSGIPFNVTSGVDTFNDSLFNERPTYSQFQATLASANVPGNVSFNCVPSAGQTEIPVNCGQSPGRFALNLRLSKTFGFGKKAGTNANAGGQMGGGTFGRGPGGPGGGGRGNRGGGPMGFGDAGSGQRYSLTLAVSARNVFNDLNEGTPVGVITSPIFGQANSLPSGPGGGLYSSRRIELQATFAF